MVYRFFFDPSAILVRAFALYKLHDDFIDTWTWRHRTIWTTAFYSQQQQRHGMTRLLAAFSLYIKVKWQTIHGFVQDTKISRAAYLDTGSSLFCARCLVRRFVSCYIPSSVATGGSTAKTILRMMTGAIRMSGLGCRALVFVELSCYG